MSNLRVFRASVSAIVLFLFGIEGFSHELQRAGRSTLSKWLEKLTKSRWRVCYWEPWPRRSFSPAVQ